MPAGRVIIHGHFYQPPRENPWLGFIEYQDSASPFHDWNERISFECYSPNTASRVLAQDGTVKRIVNNFEYMSFNIGPTLMNYLRKYHQETYDKIIEADRRSLQRVGFGNAIAQVFNHVIMPLADERDRETQVYWGIEDFRFHFDRDPDSIWLSETAVNMDTLKTLHRFGIKYVILSPHQASRVKDLSGEIWEDVSRGNIDPSIAYRIFLTDETGTKSYDKFIDAVFYDRQLSQAVAFEHLLKSSDRFAERIQEAAKHFGAINQHYMIPVVTDGESYGHHERFADMCLSSFFSEKASVLGLEVSNFMAFIAEHTPRFEAELKPGQDNAGTSWSCAHGVERWRSDCGCTTGSRAGWNQKWRKPLRKALDDLNHSLEKIFLSQGRNLFHNPENARNHYIEVILSPEYREKFLKYEMVPEQYERASERTKALALLESQKYAMMMFTSCGWFFADISGLEPTQNLKYALRAIELVEDMPGMSRTFDRFLKTLSRAESNLTEMGNGKKIFQNFVEPARVSLENRVAVRCLRAMVFGETEVRNEERYLDTISFSRLLETGNDSYHLACYSGEIFESSILEVRKFTAVTFYNRSGFDPTCRVWLKDGHLTERITDILLGSGAVDLDPLQLFEKISHFESPASLDLSQVYYDEKQELFRELMRETRAALIENFSKIYDRYYLLLEFCRSEGLSLPDEIKFPISETIIYRLNEILKEGWGAMDDQKIENILLLVGQVKDLKISLRRSEMGTSYSQLVLQGIDQLERDFSCNILVMLDRLIGRHFYLGELPGFEKVQEKVYALLHTGFPAVMDEAISGENPARQEAVIHFMRICRALKLDTSFLEKRLFELKDIMSRMEYNWA